MYNPTTRLLSILEMLQSRSQISAQELAQKLEVEERSVRRYIMMLRDMGIPIESERGRYGGYALRPSFRLPPLMFNQEEVFALMIGLLLMRELEASSTLAIESASAKIERVLPVELQQKSQALRQFITADLMSLRSYSVSVDWMLSVSLAALEQRCLTITYQSASGTTTQRNISPYGVVLHGQTWYIPAYCHLRQDHRIFRLDRVKSMALSHQDDYQPDDRDSKAYVLASLATMPGIYTFEVRIHTPLETVTEYIPTSMAILQAEHEETLMRCYSDDPHWLARFLAQLEMPFTVLQNDALRAALQSLAGRLLGSL